MLRPVCGSGFADAMGDQIDLSDPVLGLRLVLINSVSRGKLKLGLSGVGLSNRESLGRPAYAVGCFRSSTNRWLRVKFSTSTWANRHNQQPRSGENLLRPWRAGLLVDAVRTAR